MRSRNPHYYYYRFCHILPAYDHSSLIFEVQGCVTIDCHGSAKMAFKMSSDNLSHFAVLFVFKAVAGRMPCTSQNQRFGAVGVTESRESSWACNSNTALSVKTDC